MLDPMDKDKVIKPHLLAIVQLLDLDIKQPIEEEEPLIGQEILDFKI